MVGASPIVSRGALLRRRDAATGCVQCSTDDDSDGVGDATDNCPGVPNPTQSTSTRVGDANDPQTGSLGIREGRRRATAAPAASACQLASNGSTCSDGNACTQGDQCQSGSCVAGTPVACVASDQCHAAGTCNPTTGACSHPVRPDHSTCSDGDACTTGDECAAGSCVGAPIDCSDSSACTADSCVGGTCVHANTVGPCDDGDACTTGEQCAGGSCGGGLGPTATTTTPAPPTCAPPRGLRPHADTRLYLPDGCLHDLS